MQSSLAIAFDYRVSRWLQCALWLVAVLAVFALSLTALPMTLSVVAALVFGCVVVHRQRQWLKNPWRRIAWHADGSWSLGAADGAQALAVLRGYSRRGSLLVLRLSLHSGRAVDAVLFPDNLDRETFRALCVRLDRNASTTPPAPA